MFEYPSRLNDGAMALRVKHPATDEAVRRLALLKQNTLTVTIREAARAMTHGIPVLRKGNDFPRTDVAIARSVAIHHRDRRRPG